MYTFSRNRLRAACYFRVDVSAQCGLWGCGSQCEEHDTVHSLCIFRVWSREKCDGVGSQENWADDERIFMLCSAEPSNDFYQVVAETAPNERTVRATFSSRAFRHTDNGL